MTFILILILASSFIAAVYGRVTPELKCQLDSMTIKVPTSGVKSMSLDKWGAIPGCQSRVEGSHFTIQLLFTPELPCGTTRIRNKRTDESIFYHKISVEDFEGKRTLHKISCFSTSNDDRANIVKRNVLPPQFVEPDYINITSEVTGRAPIPELTVGVRQNGDLIGDKVTVLPGAPLSMEVKLDDKSSSIYGILVSYMLVTDTGDKNETIIFNGCTQDHYVFENFKTPDGDFLTAKFRAFKFPESSYLFFRGTVDVCLDRCQGIRCSNSEIGYGRRRRAVADNNDPNKIFEVTMMTFITLAEAEDPNSPFIRRQPSSSFNREQRASVQEIPSPDEGTARSLSPPYIYYKNSSLQIASSYLLIVVALAFVAVKTS